MGHTIHISDDIYQMLEKLAAQQGQPPETVVEGLITAADATSMDHHYYELDDWLHHLGVTDEEIAEADAELDAEAQAHADA
jgi:hypothetical protein